MGIFSKLLGSDKVIDAGISGIDSIFYTDEEKAENKKAFLKLYEPFKVAQRYLALVFSIPYVMMVLITFIASFFREVETQIDLLTGDIGTVVGIIVGFYFLGGSLSGGFGRNKND
jgi:hypothetical protein